MRSFREIVFRAELDGREASLVRAMGIEVVRYLQRVGRRSRARRRRPGRAGRHDADARAPTGPPTATPTRPSEPVPVRAARGPAGGGRRAVQGAAHRARSRSTASPKPCATWARAGAGPGNTAWATGSSAGCTSCGDALSATFTMSDAEEDRLGRAGRVPADIAGPSPKGSAPGRSSGAGCRSTTGARWTRSSGWPARKAEWLAERPRPHRAPQLRARRQAPRWMTDS